jgi:hypothetical protein
MAIDKSIHQRRVHRPRQNNGTIHQVVMHPLLSVVESPIQNFRVIVTSASSAFKRVAAGSKKIS